jgi:SAM-dependent methyltransferase
MIIGRTAFQRAYQDEDVAREYISRRFASPLGAQLHSKQARVLRRLIVRQRIQRAVEIAPGPARLTVEVTPLLKQLTLLDVSAEMLQESRDRLDQRGMLDRVALIQADAFRMPLRDRFQLAYTFRLVRHFDRCDRVRLYQQFATILAPGGWLVFDAVNERVSTPLRKNAAPGEYEHFDALLRPSAVREELAECGFDLVSLIGVQRRYSALKRCQVYLAPRSPILARAAMEVIDRFGGEPLEWIVISRRV